MLPTLTYISEPLQMKDTLKLCKQKKAKIKQVAQWATIAHHGASIMFGDTIISDAQRQITLKLKQ